MWSGWVVKFVCLALKYYIEKIACVTWLPSRTENANQWCQDAKTRGEEERLLPQPRRGWRSLTGHNRWPPNVMKLNVVSSPFFARVITLSRHTWKLLQLMRRTVWARWSYVSIEAIHTEAGMHELQSASESPIHFGHWTRHVTGERKRESTCEPSSLPECNYPVKGSSSVVTHNPFGLPTSRSAMKTKKFQFILISNC